MDLYPPLATLSFEGQRQRLVHSLSDPPRSDAVLSLAENPGFVKYVLCGPDV